MIVQIITAKDDNLLLGPSVRKLVTCTRNKPSRIQYDWHQQIKMIAGFMIIEEIKTTIESQSTHYQNILCLF